MYINFILKSRFFFSIENIHILRFSINTTLNLLQLFWLIGVIKKVLVRRYNKKNTPPKQKIFFFSEQ
jgi:hypothetical protein